jgi:uncharacterized BrkB/YihY/UPF0761 family membrane protein
VVDATASIIVMLASLALAAVLGYIALFLVVAGDSCAENACNYDLFTAGWLLALLAPIVVVVVGITVTIVRLVRRRRAWWTSLVAMVAAALLWWAGLQMVFVAIPTFTL